MWTKVRNYVRIVNGVRRYLRTPPIADPEAAIRERFARRQADFLETARRVVFDNPANPYRALFHAAGCTFHDLSDAVGRDGLEPTLAALHRSGVYLAHDEFKGRRPIVRPGLEIQAAPEAFVNPFVPVLMETTSSGSTGRPVRSPKGLERTRYVDACCSLVDREHGIEHCAVVELKTILPGTTGLMTMLRRMRHPRPEGAWFCAGGSWRSDGPYRLATTSVVLLARAMGVRALQPTYLAEGDFAPVARWIAERRREGVPSVIAGMVSAGTRVAAAAVELGLDISGTVFQGGGEPLTGAKLALFHQAGIVPINGYWISEVGMIGQSCRRMSGTGGVHHFSEATAIVPYRRQAPHSAHEIDSLLFTTLLPSNAFFLINVEMDDAAAVGPARCDCTFSRLGWGTAIREIYSFGKLTGQGMTLVGEDVIDILERALPARFGGQPWDFQLVEREGTSQTELDLLVSPRLTAVRPEAVCEAFFEELRRRPGGMQSERIWRHSHALRVLVAEPVATPSGKVHPLRLLSTAREATHAS